ncbi:hypothetical protein M231_04304 [Tremella mesenterica]|uniref:Uncharacterized protein n=1 Tax=Tremella mesenterica TaxID=5217 RepID=A0A4Q1BKV8_TREME|nr:hypothetical protein M231_04304 [Tremella mesenterica]
MFAKFFLTLLPLGAMSLTIPRNATTPVEVIKPATQTIEQFESCWESKCAEVAGADPRGTGATSFFQRGDNSGDFKDTNALVYCVATADFNGTETDYSWTFQVAADLGATTIL